MVLARHSSNGNGQIQGVMAEVSTNGLTVFGIKFCRFIVKKNFKKSHLDIPYLSLSFKTYSPE